MLQTEVLKDSFAKIDPQMEDFTTTFYENLFLSNPEVKPLFANTNMKAQKEKLIDSLKAIILAISLPESHSLELLLKGLGTRHVKYGALPEHYPAVGNALLQSFETYLKEEWTPEVKQAWVEAYAAITALMLEGADYSEEEVSLDSFLSISEEDDSREESLPLSISEEDDLSEEVLEASLKKNNINGSLLVGIVVVIIIALTTVIISQSQKDQLPSFQPNSSSTK